MTRLLAIALLLLAFSAGAAQARGDDHGGGDVRVAANCGSGAAASLRLRAEDRRRIEVRFRLEQRRGRGTWRIAIVHEQRIASRVTKRTTRSDDSFEVRRTLPDLQGSDTVVVHAWGPRGVGCRAAATLR